jgi:hypothetical protein
MLHMRITYIRVALLLRYFNRADLLLVEPSSHFEAIGEFGTSEKATWRCYKYIWMPIIWTPFTQKEKYNTSTEETPIRVNSCSVESIQATVFSFTLWLQ